MGLLSVLGSLLLALLSGGLAGYFGGRLDLAVSAVFNVMLTVPGLILTLAIIGVLGAGPLSLLVALIGAEWAAQGRIVRGAVLEAREQGYVEAARAVGARDHAVLGRHILPNVASTVAVLVTLDLAGVVLTVSSLSFLGIGVQPPPGGLGHDAQRQPPVRRVVPPADAPPRGLHRGLRRLRQPGRRRHPRPARPPAPLTRAHHGEPAPAAAGGAGPEGWEDTVRPGRGARYAGAGLDANELDVEQQLETAAEGAHPWPRSPRPLV